MKKALSHAIIVLVFASIPVFASASAFDDVKGTDWFHPYVERLSNENLVQGTSEGKYSPGAPLMVDEFLAFALRTMGREQGNAEGYWAQNYIDEAIRLDLVDANDFDAYNVPITREKIAKIVVRASDYEYTEYRGYERVFSDFGLIAEKGYVLKAIELGVLAGYGDGTFRPADLATRAEAAAMVVRMIDPSYRLQLYGDIFFSPKLDLNEDGNVKKEKAYDFVMGFVNKFSLEKGSGGKVVMRGYTPEVPGGQYLSMNIKFYTDKGKIIDGEYATNSKWDRLKIPAAGSFEIITDANVQNVAGIMIHIAVINSEVFGYTANFSIYKDYVDQGKSFFLRNDYTKMHKYDFQITGHIWGW